MRIEAGAVAGRVDLRIVDRGPGSPWPTGSGSSSRSSGSATPPATGSASGLAVARGFVEAMGGELSVDDTPGGGVTMVVGLPVAEEP